MSTDTARLLDPLGRLPLVALQEDVRRTYSELDARVGLSPPAVAERIRRLEEAGVITGYRAQIDLARVGLPITAFIRCTCSGPQIDAVAREVPEVLESHRITGSDTCILKVVVSSVAHLEAPIDRFLPFVQPMTSIVLSSPVPVRGAMSHGS